MIPPPPISFGSRFAKPSAPFVHHGAGAQVASFGLGLSVGDSVPRRVRNMLLKFGEGLAFNVLEPEGAIL